MPNHEQLIDELFAQVVALTPEDRAAFLNAPVTTSSAAATDSVFNEVRALLHEYDEAQAEGFLQTGFDSAVAREKKHALEPGEDFEGYRILELIGEGGMGEVYLGQDHELNRKVAIKIIKTAPTSDVLRRFQNERRILANLQHRNIAQLYEARADPKGVPFFVMEYVDGKPINQFASEHGLNLNDRLKLFRSVCSAVTRAHQNLVVHRDIKPGNILVTAAGEPKLLDFGIAKLLEEADLDAQATITRVMTPAYASPEQIKGLPVGTPSDIYSLGVLLYELLTGQRPYRLKQKSNDEIARAISEAEPIRPSQAVSNQPSEGYGKGQSAKSNGNEATAANGRLINPSAIQNPKLLRGDLDNIILKALRKEPERRYASVEQFSEDIRRHLEGLPVSAHKGTFTYRASKFVRRNKIAVAAAVLIVLTLAGGIVATTVEARRANRRFNEARQLAHTILFDYHDQIAALPGSTKVRERLVKDALQYLDNLSTDAGNDISLLRELARAYEKVAAVQGGTAVSEHNEISSSNLGDTQGALESMRKALAIRRRLVNLDSGNRDLRNELAYCYQGLASLHSLAGPPEKVVEYADQAIPILEASRGLEPANEKLLYILGATYIYKAKALGNPVTANLGDIKGAVELSTKGQAITEKLAADHPNDIEYQRSLGAMYNFASLLAGARGDEKQALELNIKAVAVDQRLVELAPNNTAFRSELAVQTGNAGSTLLKMGDAKGALEKFKQALTIYDSIIAADPNDAATRRNAGVGYRNVGVAIGTDDRPEAMRNFNQALEIFAGLVEKDGTNSDFRRQWAYTYMTLARFDIKAEEFDAAISAAQKGIDIDQVLVASSPTNVSARTTLALLHRQVGDANQALANKGGKRQWTAGKDAYQKALDIYQELQSKGTLSPADATKPDELAKEIAKCDTAIARR